MLFNYSWIEIQEIINIGDLPVFEISPVHLFKHIITSLFAGTIKCVIHLAIVRGIMYGMAVPRHKVTHFLIIMIGELDLNNKSAFLFL